MMSQNQLVFPFLFAISFLITEKTQSQLTIPQKEFTVCQDEYARVITEIGGTLPVFIELWHRESATDYIYTSESANSFRINLINTGTYDIIRYGSQDDTIDVASDSIVINNFPPVSLNLVGDGSFCLTAAENILRVYFSGVAPFTLEYYTNGELDTLTTDSEIYTFNQYENRTIETVRLSDLNCVLDTIAKLEHYVDVLERPDIIGDSVVCIGAETQFTTNNSKYTFNWVLPPEAEIIAPTNFSSQDVVLKWNTPGNSMIRLQLKDEVNLCASEWAELEITISDLPDAGENIDTTICIFLNNLVTIKVPTLPGEKVYWPSERYTDTQADFNEGGNYMYLLYNESGCVDTNMVTINDSCTQTLFVPEAFTPNNDPINDKLEIFGFYHNLEFKVYSESGMLLFTMHQGDDFWDGTVDGKDLPNGVYYWVATYTDSQGKEYKQNGHVVLLH